MLKLYHSKGTRGFRVIWLCEELGIEYEVETVDFSKEYRLSPEWLKINPLGKVPSLKDGPLLMSESCAMMQYILDRYGMGIYSLKLAPWSTPIFCNGFGFQRQRSPVQLAKLLTIGESSRVRMKYLRLWERCNPEYLSVSSL